MSDTAESQRIASAKSRCVLVDLWRCQILFSRKESVRVGERSKAESADIFAKLLELPYRNGYALDPQDAIVRDPRTGQVMTLPDAPIMLGHFILELSTDADDRRAVFQGIQHWVESQGYELPTWDRDSSSFVSNDRPGRWLGLPGRKSVRTRWLIGKCSGRTSSLARSVGCSPPLNARVVSRTERRLR